MEFETYVSIARGINISTRHQMLRAFSSNNAATQLDKLINDSPESHIPPAVRARLNNFWQRKFKETTRR